MLLLAPGTPPLLRSNRREYGPVVSSRIIARPDGGSWAPPVPPLLQAGFACCGSTCAAMAAATRSAGDYAMADIAGDIAAVLDALSIPRVHYIGLSIGGRIGQAFAIEHGDRLISAMWCDTLPASPSGAAAMWDDRMGIVRRANWLEPLADGTVERWFTDAFKASKPGRWKQIRDTVAATTPAGLLGVLGGDYVDFRVRRETAFVAHSGIGRLRRDDPSRGGSEGRWLAGLVQGSR